MTARKTATLSAILFTIGCASQPQPTSVPKERVSVQGDISFGMQVITSNNNPTDPPMVSLQHGNSVVTNVGDNLRLGKGYVLTWTASDGQIYKIDGEAALAMRKAGPGYLDFAFAVNSLQGVPKPVLDRRDKQLAINSDSAFASERLPSFGQENAPYVIWICKIKVNRAGEQDIAPVTGNAWKGQMFSVDSNSISFVDWGG